MVVTSAPSAWTASTLHDFTLWPSRWTVHAPQLLVSQPITVPVLPSCLAQVLHEQHAGFDVVGDLRSVDGEADPRHEHSRAGRLWCSLTLGRRVGEG